MTIYKSAQATFQAAVGEEAFEAFETLVGDIDDLICTECGCITRLDQDGDDVYADRYIPATHLEHRCNCHLADPRLTAEPEAEEVTT